ncbi:hypothetical protein TrLO_g13892 [Triparma laevis f. longispina]|uniref:EF-hand domain-containing protein n=1 Tax=Triparma laevis f. longispina TaxID=1714387 RepID=A0A9W7C7P9_9STRA|nr:hypothetical protein TrLO_g13892 [Triparma laevis f. longispina]
MQGGAQSFATTGGVGPRPMLPGNMMGVAGRGKRRKKKKRKGRQGAPPSIPGLIKPSKKKATESQEDDRERQLISLMEMKQPPKPSGSTKKRRGPNRGRSGNPNPEFPSSFPSNNNNKNQSWNVNNADADSDSLVFTDDDNTVTSALTNDDDGNDDITLASSITMDTTSKPTTSKSRKSTAKSSRKSTRGSTLSTRPGRKKPWIDDDDVSLQSLISEMSTYTDISVFDDNKSAVSRGGSNMSRMKIDDWKTVYPYNGMVEDGNERALRVMEENLSYNDPIARPGAQTAFDGIKNRGGMSVEETFSMSQAQKSLDIPPLLLQPPSLPEVDEHVASEELHMSQMREAVRASKGIWETTTILDTATVATVDRSTSAGGFTAKEIRLVVKFIDGLGQGDGAGDGLIDVGELEQAFRQGRRTRANAGMDAKGGTLVRRFEKMLNDAMTNLTAWFSSNDVSGGGKGDGRLGVLEIRDGIQKLAETTFGCAAWSEDDLLGLTRYLDPNGDGDLDILEFKQGIKKSKETPAALKFAMRAGRIMGRMEDFMNSNQMRIKDLFRFVDKDRSGHIDLDELRAGLTEMATTGAEKFAQKKEGLVALRKKKEEDKKKKLENEVSGRMKILSETGALNVLSSLDVYMHKTGQRIVDLFGKSGFDKSGDGCLGRKEFYLAMKHIGIECTKKECKALINIIDASGDGEIEAYELEKIVRRYRIDQIYIREAEKKHKIILAQMKKAKKHRPEIEAMSENEFVVMMNEQASKKDDLLADLKRGVITAKKEKARSPEVQKIFGTSLPKIPAIKYRAKIDSGSVLDGSWLHSFDKSMKMHKRQLKL